MRHIMYNIEYLCLMTCTGKKVCKLKLKSIISTETILPSPYVIFDLVRVMLKVTIIDQLCTTYSFLFL